MRPESIDNRDGNTLAAEGLPLKVVRHRRTIVRYRRTIQGRGVYEDSD